MFRRLLPWPRCARAGFAGALLLLALSATSTRGDVVDRDGKVHVAYWEKWVSFEEVSMQTVIDAFNRSQDKIIVDYYPVSQIDRKTLIATAGGDPPDIAGLWVQNVATYADAEALTPLDKFIKEDGMTPEVWLARYYPSFAKICQYRHHVYAGISTPAVIAFAWNRTLFREAGLDPDRPPKNLAELSEFSRRLTKHDPKTGALTQVGFLPQEPGWWPWGLAEWFGGELFDGRKITCGTDPHVLAMMTWLAHFSEQYGGKNLQTFASGFSGQFLSAQSSFMNGKVAMAFAGVWMDNYIRQFKPGLDYAVGPWPEASPGITDFALAEADVLIIPRGAKNPHAAWEFIKYVNSANEHAQSRAELQGMELLCYLQVKNSPLRNWSPFFENHHPHPYIREFRALSASPHAVCVPQMGIWIEYHRELTAAFEDVYQLAVSPARALAYCQQRMAASWSRYLLSLERHHQVSPDGVSVQP